jgi:hypothetical protein
MTTEKPKDKNLIVVPVLVPTSKQPLLLLPKGDDDEDDALQHSNNDCSSWNYVRDEVW